MIRSKQGNALLRACPETFLLNFRETRQLAGLCLLMVLGVFLYRIWTSSAVLENVPLTLRVEPAVTISPPLR